MHEQPRGGDGAQPRVAHAGAALAPGGEQRARGRLRLRAPATAEITAKPAAPAARTLAAFAGVDAADRDHRQRAHAAHHRLELREPARRPTPTSFERVPKTGPKAT